MTLDNPKQPTFDTVRHCPYHGGWIRLADCYVVATSMDVVNRIDGVARNEPVAADTPDLQDLLGAASDATPSQPNPGAEPRLGAPVGPGQPSLTTPRTRYAVGDLIRSQVDDVQRQVIALPAQPKTAPTERRRKFGFPVDTHSEALPSLADSARRYGGLRARPRRVCPDPTCLHPLPASVDERDPISIALVGNTQASKTTLIAALLLELRRHGPQILGLTQFEAAEVTLGAWNHTLSDDGRVVEQIGRTDRRVRHPPLEFTTALGTDHSPATVLVHDVSGEDIMDHNDRLNFAPQVLWADVLVFLYNPEESPAVGTLRSNVAQMAVLHGVLQDIETDPPRTWDGRVRIPPLVVAISKCDLLDSPPSTADLANPEAVKSTLRALGDAGVAQAAERWPETYWHFVAPRPPHRSPEGVVELFRRILSIAA